MTAYMSHFNCISALERIYCVLNSFYSCILNEGSCKTIFVYSRFTPSFIFILYIYSPIEIHLEGDNNYYLEVKIVPKANMRIFTILL